MFEFAFPKIEKKLKNIDTSMHLLVLMQKDQSFDQITGILFDPFQIKNALFPQLIINVAIAVLNDHTELLFRLKLCIDIDQVTMT